jgi:sodium/potassium/calcium exchanger 6
LIWRPQNQPLTSAEQILWLLTLFVATGVTATDFLCPALFMISKTLGLSQNIAGVTFLAFGNTSADIFAGECLGGEIRNRHLLTKNSD